MITRLRVKNFKSLRELELSLGALNVLVGPNMAGKSNILDVFRFLHQAFLPEAGAQGISYALAQRGGVDEVLWKGGDERLLRFSLNAIDPSDRATIFSYELELIAGAGGFTSIQSESLRLLRSSGQANLISNRAGVYNLVNADGKELSGIGATGASALQYAFPNWDGYPFYQWVRLWRFYHLVPPLMREPSAMVSGQALNAWGNNLSSWLMWLQTTSPTAFGRVNEVLCDLFPDIVQMKTIPMPDGRVHLALQEKWLKRPTNVWGASDGLLALIALLSIVYIPFHSNLSGTLFLIEEPENHLHPKLLEAFVGLLRQVRQEVVDSKATPAQIIITTQSPYLVDQMELDEITWIEKRDGSTRAIRPSDKPHLKKLVEDKELGLGELMFTGALGDEK